MGSLVKKLMIYVLCVALVVTFMPDMRAQTVYAADETEPEPAPIQDLYTIDGVNYYNAHSSAFARDPAQFYKELLLNGSSELKINTDTDRSMADLWISTGAGLMYAKEWWGSSHAGAVDEAAGESGTIVNTTSTGNHRVEKYPNNNAPQNSLKTQDMTSLKNAEAFIYRATGMNGGNATTKGYFRNNDTLQTVVPAAYKVTRTSDNNTRVVAVYFTDFKVVPILPEDEGENYVTIDNIRTKKTPAVASSVRNNSAVTVTGSQSVSNSYSTSVQSSVNGSDTYSYQESIKVGAEFKFWIFDKFNVEVTGTFTQSFMDGWSESEATTSSESTSRDISVGLPPCTSVMMTQKNVTAQAVTSYNCPVSINYDTVVVIYNGDGSVCQCSPDICAPGQTPNMIFSFTDTNARNELKKRYEEYKDIESDNQSAVDPEGIHWYVIVNRNAGLSNTKVHDALKKVMSHVPMSSTGATLTEKMDMVSSEVDGILPTLPLRKVVLEPMDVPFSQNTGSYNSYNFLSMKMPLGASTFTGYFKLSGYNARAIPYHGFDRSFGHWEIVDENENKWTGNDAPVTLTNETQSSSPKITAVRPGVCYLKYLIDENVYNTADEPDVFAKNSDLASTAIIRIEVPDERTIDVRGQFEGYADEDPAALDDDGKLEAVVCDASGKELNGEFSVTWEAKEKSNISIEAGNMVSFTKPGTYHVRACMGDIKSDWVEITAKKKHVLEKADGREPTCEENGVMEHYVCTDCQKLFSDAEAKNELAPEDIVIPATHDLVKTKRKAATCTERGNIEYYTCSKCGGYFKDREGKEELSEEDLSIPALDHDWSEWETVTAPTEDEEGLESRFCKNNPSHTQTRAVPTLDHKHKMVKTPKKLPTSTEDGNIMYYTCSGCGRLYTDAKGENEIDPLDTVLPAEKTPEEKPAEPTKTETPTSQEPQTKPAPKTSTAPAVNPEGDKNDVTTIAGTENQIVKIKNDKDPKGAAFAILRLKAAKTTKTANKLTWTRVKGASGYYVFGNRCGSRYAFKRLARLTGPGKIKWTHKKLKKGTYYKYIVVAYKTSNGVQKVITTSKTAHVATAGGKVGNYKAVKLNEKSIVLKRKKTYRIKATEIAASKKLKVKRHRKLSYESSNKKIASVTSTGKVKALKKGTCYIYAYTQSGTWARIKVKVN